MRRSGVLLGFAAVAAAAATAVALDTVTRGDTYCGRVLWDTNLGGGCHDPMVARRLIALILGAFACALTLVALRWSIAAVLIVVAGVSCLVAVNRLFEPTVEHYCGSVLNRHRTYDAAFQAECDQLLRPHLVEGVSATAVAFCSAVGAAALVAARTARTPTPHLP
jgi:hypothetical protein